MRFSHPAQYDLARPPSWLPQKTQARKKSVTWLPCLRSGWRVLQSLCQPTPTRGRGSNKFWQFTNNSEWRSAWFIWSGWINRPIQYCLREVANGQRYIVDKLNPLHTSEESYNGPMENKNSRKIKITKSNLEPDWSKKRKNGPIRFQFSWISIFHWPSGPFFKKNPIRFQFWFWFSGALIYFCRLGRLL